jgi:hypothetical protein
MTVKRSESLFVVNAYLNGTCSDCGEPTTGEFDSDDDRDDNDEYWVTLTCVNCYKKHVFSITPEVRTFQHERDVTQ